MTLQYFLHNGKLPGGCPGSALALTIRLFAVSWTGAEILHTADRDQDLLLQTYIVWHQPTLSSILENYQSKIFERPKTELANKGWHLRGESG